MSSKTRRLNKHRIWIPRSEFAAVKRREKHQLKITKALGIAPREIFGRRYHKAPTRFQYFTNAEQQNKLFAQMAVIQATKIAEEIND